MGPSSLGVTIVGDCKSLKIKNARLVTHTHITNEKNMKSLVGGPLLVGGLGPGPPGPPLNPALQIGIYDSVQNLLAHACMTAARCRPNYADKISVYHGYFAASFQYFDVIMKPGPSPGLLLFRPFTDTNVGLYGTAAPVPLKYGKLATKCPWLGLYIYF